MTVTCLAWRASWLAVTARYWRWCGPVNTRKAPCHGRVDRLLVLEGMSSRVMHRSDGCRACALWITIQPAPLVAAR